MAAFQFFNIFRRWQAFWPDSPFQQSIANTTVVFYMLITDRHFSGQIMLPYIVGGNGCGEFLSLESNGRKEVRYRTTITNTQPGFHLLGIMTPK